MVYLVVDMEQVVTDLGTGATETFTAQDCEEWWA